MFDFGLGFGFGVAAYGISSAEAIGAVGRIIGLGALNVAENGSFTQHYKGRTTTWGEKGKAFVYGGIGGLVGEGMGLGLKAGAKYIISQDTAKRLVVKMDRVMARQWLDAYEAGLRGSLRGVNPQGAYNAGDVAELINAHSREHEKNNLS